MKRYFYHIVYEMRTNDLTVIGSVQIGTDKPITHEEQLHSIAEQIKAEHKLPKRPIISNFLLLRREGIRA